MRKPLDPRKHGLKEPQKVLTKVERLPLPMIGKDYSRRSSLQAINAMWAKVSKDMNFGENVRVIDGPYVDGSSLEFTWETDNQDYDLALSEFQARMEVYEKDLLKWKQEEERKKNKQAMEIDEQIVRTERRLANLKATKEGKTLPYPTG